MTKRGLKACKNALIGPKHIIILNTMLNYPRYRTEIQDIVQSTISLDLHNGVLKPILEELQRWDYIERLNPNASRREGYKYAITPQGREKVKEFAHQFRRMAEMQDQYA